MKETPSQDNIFPNVLVVPRKGYFSANLWGQPLLLGIRSEIFWRDAAKMAN